MLLVIEGMGEWAYGVRGHVGSTLWVDNSMNGIIIVLVEHAWMVSGRMGIVEDTQKMPMNKLKNSSTKNRIFCTFQDTFYYSKRHCSRFQYQYIC